LIRALYEWCCDHNFTPYLAVWADERVQVPREHVNSGEIVLNISPTATSALKLGSEWIEFKARFGGVAREILVPVDRVMAVYARENGQGMSFPMSDVAHGPVPQALAQAGPVAPVGKREQPRLQSVKPQDDCDEPFDPPPSGKDGGASRPSLKRIK
jgi:stringent starvation protein B